MGALPEVVPLSLGLLFSAVAHSGWRLDTSRLLDAASAASSGQEKVLPSTLFERDFTLSFWLQREPKKDDDHETILCSQEDTGENRFFLNSQERSINIHPSNACSVLIFGINWVISSFTLSAQIWMNISTVEPSKS